MAVAASNIFTPSFSAMVLVSGSPTVSASTQTFGSNVPAFLPLPSLVVSTYTVVVQMADAANPSTGSMVT